MIADYLAWGMSILGGGVWMLYGNQSVWGPILGLLHQAIVVVYAVVTNHLGLLPGVGLYSVVHCRNLWKQRRERALEARRQ